MLLSGSATNSRIISPEENRLRLDESLFLINTRQWYCAYVLLSPLEKNTNNIATLYNLGLCYFHIDEYDRAISVLQQALTVNQSSVSLASCTDTIKNKLLQHEYKSDNYLFALPSILANVDPVLVQQRVQRLLVDIYVQKSCWQEVLNLARQLNNDYPNVLKARQLAEYSLESETSR